MTDNRFTNRSELIGILVLAAFLVVILPLCLDVFRLNLVAKYLTYAFVALGLVICWGYGGILSLGQGVFFGLGGYCMAMFLKLEASSVENTKIQSTPGIPDFMDWNQITQLPLFWKPFHSLSLTVLAILLVPSIFAFIIGAAMFKRRVGGVYFAIITQAIAAILTILIVGQAEVGQDAHQNIEIKRRFSESWLAIAVRGSAEGPSRAVRGYPPQLPGGSARGVSSVRMSIPRNDNEKACSLSFLGIG